MRSGFKLFGDFVVAGAAGIPHRARDRWGARTAGADRSDFSSRRPFPFCQRPGKTRLPLVLAVLLIYFGVYPSPLLNLIHNTMAGLSFATQMGPP